MKKGKLIAMLMVISLLLMGIGYAYWTETITVNGTADTGELSVQFVESHFPSSIHDDYSNVTTEMSTNTLKVKFQEAYPGMYMTVSAEMENKGTLPAVFDRAEVSFNGPVELKDALYISWLNGAFYDANDDLINESVKYYTDVPLASLEEKLNDLFRNIRLEPGQYLVLNSNPLNETAKSFEPYLDIYVDHEAGNEIEDKQLEFEIKLHWKQFNQ